MVHKMAKGRARPVEISNQDVSQLDEELPSQGVIRAEVLPLLMSLACVGVVTAVLLLLDRAIAANLVAIAYLLPVIVAATQWGVWPATLASLASIVAAAVFFFPPIYSFRGADPTEAIV